MDHVVVFELCRLNDLLQTVEQQGQELPQKESRALQRSHAQCMQVTLRPLPHSEPLVLGPDRVPHIWSKILFMPYMRSAL